jgi:Condensation domain
VFQQALLADGGSRAAQSGRFRDWVRWQRRRFPLDQTAAATPEREFWLRYLDGTPPERPVRLPFWSDGPLSGVAEIVHQELPADAAALAAAARRLRVTPFSVFLAAVASAISTVSGADDITLLVHVTGRRPGYLDTLGPFGETLPLRIRHAGLADRRAALAAARNAWISTLPFQATPWDYIRAVCANPDAPSSSGGPPQVMVNFMPWAPAPLDWRFYETQTQARMSMSTLHLSAAVRADSSYHLSCLFDPSRYTATGVRELLDLIHRNWRQYLSGDENERGRRNR